MAKLQKLQISGIRSFGPYDEQTLSFKSPVTLILGQNGSGKTTIIESIKFACTDDVPEGSVMGQGFVNDPKMSGNSSTKGQIKLKFIDPRDNIITISRVVEVVQTAKKMSFKRVSNTIKTVDPDGNSSSISNRCTDITSECCQRLNVPPSVLNNVIFCHQENSSWPLEEGKKLKERFDDIFDAAKYNNCVDNFRKAIKTRETRLKILNTELVHRKEKKAEMDMKNLKLQQNEERRQRFEEDIENKKEELKPVKERLIEIFELEQNLSNLQNQLTAKEATMNSVVEEQNTIIANLPFIFEGSDTELKNKISSFQSDRQKDENIIADLEKRASEIDKKREEIRKIVQEIQTQFGILNEKKTQYTKKCNEVKISIEQTKNKMNITDFNANGSTAEAIFQLKNALELQDLCLENLNIEAEEELEKLQKALDSAKEIVASTTHSIQTKSTEMQENEQKLNDIKSQLQDLSISDDYMQKSNKKINGYDQTITKLKENCREAEETQAMEKNKKDIQTMEMNLESLESDYRVLLQNDVTESKIETEKRNILEKQKEVNRIKNLHSNNLGQMFNEQIPQRNLKDAVLLKQCTADSIVDSLRERIVLKQKEVTTLEVQKKNEMEKIAQCEKELRLNRNKISQACQGRDFNETLKSTFEKKERLQIDKGQYSSVRIIYNQFIKKFENEKPCCPVCDTDFSNKKSIVQHIISTLKMKVDRVPQELNRVEAELEKEEELYSKLQQLKFTNEEVEQISTEKLPSLKQHLLEIEQKLKDDKTELDNLNQDLKEPEQIVEISKRVISDVGSLDQNQLDVEKSQRNIESLKMDLVHVASKKCKQEVEAEIDQLKSEISELRAKNEAQSKKISNHKDRIQQLLQERSYLVDQQVRLKENLQSMPILERQQSELDEKLVHTREKLSFLKNSLVLQQKDVKAAAEKRDSSVKKNKLLLEEQRSKLSEYKKLIDNIENVHKEINKYLDDNIDSELSETERKLEENRRKDSVFNETKTELLNKASKKREDLAKDELRFRTLKNNVVLREKKAAEKSLEIEIQSLTTQIGGFNYRTVHEEKIRLDLKRNTLEREVNNIIGEKNGLITVINDLRQELELPQNKKAYSEYMKKFYEKRITEHAINDIRKYTMALERAIVDFHKSKMVQINKTIRDLWRNTYRGNDIDYIEIKTEYASGTATRRSYEYKVVQVKKGVELDMRGRCSAGQKVLCCLIIRMALAETMSSNCGILALDEPTTNLDKANIYSLCDTLTRIISDRKQERSFQLIIITHDEEFLNALSRVQAVDCYYRIQRNHEGFSVIEREDFGH